MPKSKEGEDIASDFLLKGTVYDTRYCWNCDIERTIDELENGITENILSKRSALKMKCFLDKGTELRKKYTGDSFDKIPFDFFVENGEDAYFVEIKTKTKAKDFHFSWNDTETIGMWAARDCRIPLYFIILHAQDTDLKSSIPPFEFLEIVRYKGRPIPVPNTTSNKKLLNNTNFFVHDSCDKNTCKKIIKQEYLDLII